MIMFPLTPYCLILIGFVLNVLIHPLNLSWSNKSHRLCVLVAGATEVAAESSPVKGQYFLAVIVFVRNDVNYLLEFIQHYIEEGVDHIFIYDEGSKDGSIESISCIDAKFYTVYTQQLLGLELESTGGGTGTGSASGTSQLRQQLHLQQTVLDRIYVHSGVRSRTEWLAVLEVQDFISSRAQPFASKTLRQLLTTSSLRHCSAISVPTVEFSLPKDSPRTLQSIKNSFRLSVQHRTSASGFISTHGTGVGAGTGIGAAVVENKVILRTERVSTLSAGRSYMDDARTQRSFFADNDGGTVCIPLLSDASGSSFEDGNSERDSGISAEKSSAVGISIAQFNCASRLSEDQRQSLQAVKQSPDKNNGFYIGLQQSHAHAHVYAHVQGRGSRIPNELVPSHAALSTHAHASIVPLPLPQWCPFSNSFAALQPPSHTLMSDADYPRMLLLCARYPHPSSIHHHPSLGLGRPILETAQAEPVGGAAVSTSGPGVQQPVLILDDFMSAARHAVRSGQGAHESKLEAKSQARSADFAKAAELMQACPRSYFSHPASHGSGSSLSVGDAQTLRQDPAVAAAAEGQVSQEEQLQLLRKQEQQLMKQLQREAAGSAEGDQSKKKKKYFFAVMLHLRDEVDILLEFIQHYLEEGAEHIYIYDDQSSDESMEALRCVDPQYYSLFNSTNVVLTQQVKHSIFSQMAIYSQLYLKKGVKKQTEWLTVVDADELITSRAYPELTIKEILQRHLADCDAVGVPWLIYSYGNFSHTPRNRVREQLSFRWGYDERFRVPGDEKSKFRDRVDIVQCKPIFKTSKVANYQDIHDVKMADRAKGGLICVPHTEPTMFCAANHSRAQPGGVDLDAFRSVVQFPALNKELYLDQHGGTQGYPKGCPFSNRFVSVGTPPELRLAEQDVDKLQLACAHYRLKSRDDWARKRAASRFNGWEYEGEERQANRNDVFDDFMRARRNQLRRNHPDFIRAAKAVERCPSRFYSLGEDS